MVREDRASTSLQAEGAALGSGVVGRASARNGRWREEASRAVVMKQAARQPYRMFAADNHTRPSLGQHLTGISQFTNTKSFFYLETPLKYNTGRFSHC